MFKPRAIEFWSIDPDLGARYEAALRKATSLEKLKTFVQAQEPGGVTQALGNLPAPVISSVDALADPIQIAALKGDDLQAANMQKQLQALEANNLLLREINNTLKDKRLLPGFMY